MAQKSHFKMQMDGSQHKARWTFPQWPGNTVHNPKYIQTAQGGKLLIDGWWAYLRKPVSHLLSFRNFRLNARQNYAADIVQVMTWGLCAGFGTPIIYWYPFFFFVMFVLSPIGFVVVLRSETGSATDAGGTLQGMFYLG